MAVILSINGNLDKELQSLGHEVISINMDKAGVYSAMALFAKCTKTPEYVIQREHLAAKIIFSDIHLLPCRTAFWSIDTHLNYSWQMYYSALFDVFLTPHKSFIARLGPDWQHPNTHRLAQNGITQPFIPHANREHNITFVGRLIGTRPQRERISEFLLEQYNVNIITDIKYTPMLKLYTNTRIIPNEAIANEVNFRLLEGASCGACVISPYIGKDQDILFEPNKEILIYHNMEELKSHIDHCLHDTSFCEKIGYAAWQRVQNEHSEQHRAKQLFEAIKGDELIRQNDNDFFQLTMLMLSTYDEWEIANKNAFINDAFHTTANKLLAKLFTLTIDQDLKEIESNIIANILQEVDLCILSKETKDAHKKILAIACGGVALELKDMPRSFFYFRLYEKCCQCPTPSNIPKNYVQMAMLWVQSLKRENKQTIVGYSPKSGCYRTAKDFIELSKNLDPFDMSWIDNLATLDHVLHSYPMQEKEKITKLLDD